ncbi:MAG: hypothetical protein QOJ65_2632 [Fimbriimonadaceae bacterium]|nr:hypothetical protein [Fimbriimonadaceae bacterium]
MDRYKSLKTFKANGRWQMVAGEHVEEPRRRFLVYAAPNRFKVVSLDPRGAPFISVSDGKSQAEYSLDPQFTPIAEKAPPSLADAKTPFIEHILYGGSLLYQMFRGREGFDKVVDEKKGNVTFGDRQLLPNKEPAREVKFYAVGPYGNVRMLINERTGLLYRIQYDGKPMREEFLASERAKAMSAKDKETLAKQRYTEVFDEVFANVKHEDKEFVATVPPDILEAAARANPGPLFEGKPAPDIVVRAIDGKEVHVKDFRGKKVLIDFWATWCVPCQVTLPHTAQLAKTHGKDVVVLAITSEDPKIVRAFLKSKKLDLPVYIDKGAKAWDVFKVASLPSFILIDEKGVVQTYLPGYNEERMHEALQKAGLES